MQPEAVEQYGKALRMGQKYYRNAVSRGAYPYPPALDELIPEQTGWKQTDIGIVNVPAHLIVGTKTTGRVSALAGNFMPLLDNGTEFASKWISLCDIQLTEGIRDPALCFEYLGRFYVQEGNKRVSVLKSLDSTTIPCQVTRIEPKPSDDPILRNYNEFKDFFALSHLYGVEFHRSGEYARLQAALGFDPDHVWTEDERRSFTAGFAHFTAAFEKLGGAKTGVTASDALMVWLQVYSFADIKALGTAELTKQLSAIWKDVESVADPLPMEVNTQPEEKGKTLLGKLISVARPDHIHAAFFYAFSPTESAWTKSHDLARDALEQSMGERIDTTAYLVPGRNYYAAMESAAEDGAQVIFATSPAMLSDCRKLAAQYPELRVLNCGLSLPSAGVRTYFSRIHECKFITGAIAGAISDSDTVGYIANYPLTGTPANINAFALGARMTNPNARVRVVWSCTEGSPMEELRRSGVTLLANRDAATAGHAHWALEWGLYALDGDGALTSLASPVWNWAKMYEQIIESMFSGVWDELSRGKAINYWWGMDSGVIDIRLSDALPDGVHALADILRDGLCGGRIQVFRGPVRDQAGQVRSSSDQGFTPEELLRMDWLCENVDGILPSYEELLPGARDIVRALGLHRDTLPPEKEPEPQL